MSTQTTLKTHHFTLTLTEVAGLSDELQGDLLKAGCDDASLWSEGPVVYLEFDRASGSLGDAIGSAVRDVERAGLAVARVDVGG